MKKLVGVVISGKNLAALAMPNACPRCFWVKTKLKLPYQLFPGIFSSLDAYTKRVFHRWIDDHKNKVDIGIPNVFAVEPPGWLHNEMRYVVNYTKTLHHTKFRREDEKTGIIVSGQEDDRWRHAKGGLVIPDFKTAKYTANQDALYPLYEGQLNFYGWIEEGFKEKVYGLFLIYCEPVTDEKECVPAIFNYDGFILKLRVKGLPIIRKPEIVRSCLDRAHEILSNSKPPLPVPGCEDCSKTAAMLKAIYPSNTK